MNRNEKQPREITFARGEHSNDELVNIVITQIDSELPQQIRVEEGMGHMIHRSERFREIRQLPPEERELELSEIVEDMATADVVRIENPPDVETAMKIPR